MMLKHFLIFLSFSSSAFAMLDDPLSNEKNFFGTSVKVQKPHPTDFRSLDPRWKGQSAIYGSCYPKVPMVLPYDHYPVEVPFAAAPAYGQAPQILENYCAQHFPNHKKIYFFVVQPLQAEANISSLRLHYFVHPDAPTLYEGVDYTTKAQWTVVPGAQGQIEPLEGNFQTVGVPSAEVITHDPGSGRLGTSPNNMQLIGFNEEIDKSGHPYIPSKDMYSLVVLDQFVVFTYHWLLNDTVGLSNQSDLHLLFPHLEKANTFRDLINRLEPLPSFKNLVGELKTYVKYSHVPAHFDPPPSFNDLLGKIKTYVKYSLIPVEWDYSNTRDRFPPSSHIIQKGNNAIEITTDCSQPHFYQLESKALKVNPGDMLQLAYNIEGKTDGLTLILRDKTTQLPLGPDIELQEGYNNINGGIKYSIPQNTRETSILLYNKKIIPSTTITINSLKVERFD